MSERIKSKKTGVEVEVKDKPTKRATVTIPIITDSNSAIRLRKKNRKIVESLKNNNKKMFTF